MEFIIMAFRSRAHTIKFYNLLKANGLSVEIINTPKEAGVGCGLSIKFMPQNLNLVKRAFSITSLSSFAGFFAVKDMGGRRFVKPL